MRFKRQIFLVLGTIAFGAPALADQYFQILPALAVQGSSPLTVEYSLPCGSQFQGFLLKVVDQRFEVSVVAKHNGFVCGSVEETLRAELPIAVPKAFEVGTAKSSASIEPVVRLGASEAVVSRKGSKFVLHSEYVSGCGEYQGTLLYPRDPVHWAVSHIESMPTEDETRFCVPVAKTVSLDPVVLTRRLSVTAIQAPADLTQRYSLQFAAIDHSSLQVATNKVSLRYFRTCQDRPLGFVVSPDRRTVGVMLARFYNKKCTALPRWDRLDSSSLKLTHVKRKFFSERTASDLIVKTPLAVESDIGVVIKYSNSCNQTAGILMHETHKELSLGVVQIQANNRCQKNLSEETLKPLVQQSTKKLKPLVI
jgi:hypothetical protein